MSESVSNSPRVQYLSAILWPSFLVAGAATAVFFTLFDPQELFAGTAHFAGNRLGAYSSGFLLFWLITATSSALTTYFLRPPETVNPARPPGTGAA